MGKNGNKGKSPSGGRSAVTVKSLADRIISLVEEARRQVANVANVALVYTYYEVGRMIVEDEQGGQRRATYGKEVLKDLSRRLTERFGSGWSVETLTKCRYFYTIYSTREIVHTVDDFHLSWSHYLVLMRIDDPAERAFYEREASAGPWSLAQLNRQIGSQLYERFQKHKGKTGVRELMWKSPKPDVAEEPLKDPYTLEFLGLPEKTEYSESQLEQAIIDHIQEFMLELGKGFAFIGRQVRFTFEEEHYRVDLVFYNRLTRSFFVFDLKLGKITHQDVGQMQMYVHYYDRVVKLPDENPTIGILLSSEEVKEATVKMTLPECEHNRIFARQYKTVLPTASAFKRIIRQEQIAHEKRLLMDVKASPKDRGIK